MCHRSTRLITDPLVRACQPIGHLAARPAVLFESVVAVLSTPRRVENRRCTDGAHPVDQHSRRAVKARCVLGRRREALLLEYHEIVSTALGQRGRNARALLVVGSFFLAAYNVEKKACKQFVHRNASVVLSDGVERFRYAILNF